MNPYTGDMISASGKRGHVAPSAIAPVPSAPAMKNPFTTLKPVNPYAGSALPSLETTPPINMSLPSLPNQPMQSPADAGYAPSTSVWDNFWGSLFPAAAPQAQAVQQQASWADILTGQSPTSRYSGAINYPDAPITLDLNEPRTPPTPEGPPVAADADFQPSAFDWSNPFGLSTPAQSQAPAAQEQSGSWLDRLFTPSVSSVRSPAVDYPDQPLFANVLAPLPSVGGASGSWDAQAAPVSTWPSFSLSTPVPQINWLAVGATPAQTSAQIQQPFVATPAASNMPIWIGAGVVGAALLAFIVLSAE